MICVSGGEGSLSVRQLASVKLVSIPLVVFLQLLPVVPNAGRCLSSLGTSLCVERNEKSTGEGGGAGVSAISCAREVTPEALKAALTSWPKVEFVRMGRRWRGLMGEV